MKPFDLEAAKRGEPICTDLEYECKFIGIDSKGCIVVEDDDGLTSFTQEDLRMTPKRRTVWVNLYPHSAQAFKFNSKKIADEFAFFRSENRIGGKAWPLEVEE